jgi:hypothetical protein
MRVRTSSAAVAIAIVLGQVGLNSHRASGQQTQPEGLLEQIEEARLDVQLLELKLQSSERAVGEAVQAITGGASYPVPAYNTPAPYPPGYVEPPKPDYAKARAKRLEASRDLRKAKKRLIDLEVRLAREQPQPPKAEPDGAKRRAAIYGLQTEIELLQLEVAADKAQLEELMKAARKAETRTVLGPLADGAEPPMTAEEASEILSWAEAGGSSVFDPTGQIETWLTKLASKALAGDHVARETYTAFLEWLDQVAKDWDEAMGDPALELSGAKPPSDTGSVTGSPKADRKGSKADREIKKGFEAKRKALEAAEKKTAEIQTRRRDEVRVLLEQKKEHFARMLTELNEKRTALAEAEKASGQGE